MTYVVRFDHSSLDRVVGCRLGEDVCCGGIVVVSMAPTCAEISGKPGCVAAVTAKEAVPSGGTAAALGEGDTVTATEVAVGVGIEAVAERGNRVANTAVVWLHRRGGNGL